jgi:DUF1009 family protein
MSEAPARSDTTLGIIAGGGELPTAIAAAAREGGREVFVLGISGMASESALAPFPHALAGRGELGKAIKLLKEAHCTEVTFAGRVPRPQFSKIKLDAKGALALPWIVGAARRGDDALMRTVLGLFEKEGFRVIGSDEAAHALLVPRGLIGGIEPDDQELADIARAVKVVRAMGQHDIGQAAVVCEGLVLAIEAAEGTDEMLRRVAELPEALRGTPSARRGVLVKAPKPGQERRVDLPVIGQRTLDLAAAAGLGGIAVQAASTLILHRHSMVTSADANGMFLLGFAAGDYPA